MLQVVDDYLALESIKGQRIPSWGDEVPVVPWLAHFRLVRALTGGPQPGSLSRSAFEGALAAAIDPPEDVLRVLDPRLYTAQAAQLVADYNISTMGAAMLAPAVVHGGRVHVHTKNLVERWYGVVEGSEARIEVYTEAQLGRGR